MSNENDKPAGVLGMFDDVDSLMAACRRMRDAGFTKWEAHSPFPVHGLDEAAGIKPTILPWIVLVCGLTGTTCAIVMQWWMNAIDYPLIISGKPLWSIPANVPVAFEMTILFSAFAAFFGMMILNGFPRWSNPLLRVPEFARVTADRFAISVDSADPNFNLDGSFLREIGASQVISVPQDPTSNKLPLPVHLMGGMATVLALIPIVLILRARYITSDSPRIHVVPDMDFQWKSKAQTASTFFADGRSMRKAVEGTVAVGDVVSPDMLAFDAGATTFTDPETNLTWRTDLPVSITEELLDLGEQKYAIHCQPCHGAGGYGDGPVNGKALKSAGSSWVQVANLHEAKYANMPSGRVYSAIVNGVNNGNMPSYAASLTVEERWAVVVYMAALQRSQNALQGDLPAGVQPKESK